MTNATLHPRFFEGAAREVRRYGAITQESRALALRNLDDALGVLRSMNDHMGSRHVPVSPGPFFEIFIREFEELHAMLVSIDPIAPATPDDLVLLNSRAKLVNDLMGALTPQLLRSMNSDTENPD